MLDVSTGWFDAGIVDGQNKLVPTVTFTLKNVSDQKLRVLQVNALFRRVTENDEWGSGLVTVAGSDGPRARRDDRDAHRASRRSATPAPIRASRCSRTRSSWTRRSICSRSTGPRSG